ncbi:MAG TPA: phenylalanine--tRNA ligase subunit beta [bacterium]
MESGPPIRSLTSIEILEPKFCPRYSARIIRGAKIAPSPDWMRLRLQAVGLRSINNVVDVTNYVLLEMGHPMHAFDFNRLEGRRISVRCAQAGEKFITLDEQERTLDDRMLLICDGARGVALAGVMGGLNSEISENTTDLLLESAYFDPISTRRTSRLLGLSTDSSRRFERGADPEATVAALDRAAELILQLAGGQVAAGVYDAYPKPIPRPVVRLRPKRVEQILGVKVPKREIEKQLAALECKVSESPPEKALQVQVPSFRPDLEREIDLIEEVARLHGYNQIPTAESARVPLAVPYSFKDAAHQQLSNILIWLGFTQIKTTSLLAEKEVDLPDYPVPVKLKNPASEDMAYLRNGLLPGLLKVAAHNLHRGTADFRLFDVGRVFCRKDGEYSEWDALAGLLAGLHEPGRWDQSPQPASFLDLKGLVEEMLMQISLDKFDFFCYDIGYGTGDALGVRRSGQFAGFLGQVHPAIAQRFEVEVPVFAFEFRMDALVDEISERLNYRPFPKYPPVQRDLAFVLADDLPAGEVLTKMQTWGGPHLVSCDLFDVYRGAQAGEGKKSVAFRLKFQSLERTLTDAETDSAVQRLIERMAENYDAKLRS